MQPAGPYRGSRLISVVAFFILAVVCVLVAGPAVRLSNSSYGQQASSDVAVLRAAALSKSCADAESRVLQNLKADVSRLEQENAI